MTRRRLLLTSSVLVFLLLFAVSLVVGSYPLTLRQIGAALIGRGGDEMGVRVFWGLRFPRTVMAALSGAVLALCGGVYQLIFQNPLASPDLTGVASGASLGAAVAIVLGSGASAAVMGGAFVCGLASLVLVLLLVRFSRREQSSTYVLAGVIVSSLCEAGLMILKRMADPEGALAALEFWTMGSLASVTAEKLLAVAPITVLSALFLLLFHRQAEMLSLSDADVRGMGLSPRLFRSLFAVLTTLCVSSVISVTGVISFVGLIAPHIAARLFGRRSNGFLPYCALCGATLLMLADIFARSLASGAELPLSIFTVLFSAPFLAAMLMRGGQRRDDS